MSHRTGIPNGSLPTRSGLPDFPICVGLAKRCYGIDFKHMLGLFIHEFEHPLMSCVLRISWPVTEASLLAISLAPYRVEDGVAHFWVSNADFSDFKAQVADAIAFLQSHRADVELLMSEPSASGVLDFAIEWRNVMVQVDTFPSTLIREAGSLGLALELSHYPTSEEPSTEA